MSIKKRLLILEQSYQAATIGKRTLDDFYADVNNPDSDHYAALEAFYQVSL